MELFKLAPTTVMLLAFFFASCIFVYCDFRIKCVILLLSVLLFIVLRIVKRSTPTSDILRKCLLYALCAVAVAGLYSIAVFDIYYSRFPSLSGTSDTVRVQIKSCDYSLSYMARYIAVVTGSENIPKNTKILLSSEQVGLEDGTVLEGNIVYSALSESSSSGFDAEKYYLPKRIFLTAEDESLCDVGINEKLGILDMFQKFSHKLTIRIVANTKRDHGGMAAAVLLGNKEYLADSTSRDFRRLGISHLLVVSGTHFSVILAFASRAMIYMRLRRRKRAVISIGLILFFMALTGFSGSVLRAGIMYLIAQIAILADRRVNALHSLALAGSVIVLVNPFAAADCGLQLSFVSAYSCLLYNALRFTFYRWRKAKRKLAGKTRRIPRNGGGVGRFIRSIGNVIGLTVVVNVTLLPLIWLYFGEFSLLSVPSNIVFIPMVTVLMYLTGLFLLQYPLGILTYQLGKLIDLYCTVMLGLAEKMAGLENIMVPVNYSFSVYFLIPLTVMLIILPFVSAKKLRVLSVGMLSVLATFFIAIGGVQTADRSNVYFSYVTTKSKNDGFVLKSNGKALLCDISDGSYGYLSELTNEMAELHSCEAETLLLTHYHNKHISYLERLSDREILRTLVLPAPIDEREDGIYKSLRNIAKSKGIEVLTLDIGEWYEFGSARLLVHERMYISRSTHPITAVSVEAYDNLTTVLSCSFNQSYEELTEYAERSDHVIFGHHSPVYKKVFGLSFESRPKTVITSSSACEYMTEEFASALETMYTIHEPIEWCIKIDQNGNCTTEE